MYILLLGVILWSSCSEKKPIVYDEGSWYELWEQDKTMEIEVIDTLCISRKTKAQRDLKNGNKTYYAFGSIRYDEELAELLANYGIKMDFALTTCFRPPPGFTHHCYERTMNDYIERAYGSHFMDSIKLVADQMYVMNRPHKIFEFENCDRTPRYPKASNYNAHFELLKADYHKNFKYPKNYHYKNEKYYSYTSGSFIIYKDSTISDIEVSTTFQNPDNAMFREQFDNNMINFIKNTAWKPAKSAGIVVNSKMRITIHYD